jgi:hypothetical protein
MVPFFPSVEVSFHEMLYAVRVDEVVFFSLGQRRGCDVCFGALVDVRPARRDDMLWQSKSMGE